MQPLARTVTTNTWRGVGPYHDDDPTSFKGIKLLETTECNKLYILNTMFATRLNEHGWSFHSNIGYKRRLDYIMADWYVKRATTNLPCLSDAKPNF